jgi:hypothetical protein
MARDIFYCAIDTAEFVANLDDRESYQARIETEGAFHLLLGPDGGVKLHDKVVALAVLSLMFRRRPWQIELTPVLKAANHSFVVQDLLAGNSCDPGD